MPHNERLPEPPAILAGNALIDSPPLLLRSMPMLFSVALILTFLFLASANAVSITLAETLAQLQKLSSLDNPPAAM